MFLCSGTALFLVHGSQSYRARLFRNAYKTARADSITYAGDQGDGAGRTHGRLEQVRCAEAFGRCTREGSRGLASWFTLKPASGVEGWFPFQPMVISRMLVWTQSRIKSQGLIYMPWVKISHPQRTFKSRPKLTKWVVMVVHRPQNGIPFVLTHSHMECTPFAWSFWPWRNVHPWVFGATTPLEASAGGSPSCHPASQLLNADLFTIWFPFWSTFSKVSKGPKRLTLYFWVLWASESLSVADCPRTRPRDES